MQETDFMHLKVWNDLDDPYDHTELAENWQRIDDHDHTTAWGKKVPYGGVDTNAISQNELRDGSVGTNEIIDGAVTTAKLADNSVNSAKIIDGSIQGVDIGTHQIGISHMTTAALSAIAPLGMVLAWFRPTTSVNVPQGWAICDGATIADNDWGGTPVVIPDLRNKFILGAGPIANPAPGTPNGTGVATPPQESLLGAATTGGAQTRDLSHTHPVPSHTHTSNAHIHGVNNHTHTVWNHTHPIAGDNAHNHQLRTRGVWVLNGAQPGINEMMLQAAYIGDYNAGPADLGVPGIPAHSHGGATGGQSNFESGGATPATGTQTDSGMTSVSQTTSNNTQNIGADLRPAFVGLLYIIKVKNPV